MLVTVPTKRRSSLPGAAEADPLAAGFGAGSSPGSTTGGRSGGGEQAATPTATTTKSAQLFRPGFHPFSGDPGASGDRNAIPRWTRPSKSISGAIRLESAAERVRRGIGSTSREGLTWRRTSQEQELEQVHGIPQIEHGIVVGIGRVDARGGFFSEKEMTEEVDGIAHVEAAVRIRISPEKGPRNASHPERRPQPIRIPLVGQGGTAADVREELLWLAEGEDQVLAARFEPETAQGLVVGGDDAQNLLLGSLPDGLHLEGHENPELDGRADF